MSSFRRGACVALLLIACNKSDKSAPPPASGIPPLDQPAGAAPAAGDHPTHPPTTAGGDNAALPPGHPELPPGHPPMGEAAPSGAFGGATPGGDFDPKTVLAGVIKVDNKVKTKVSAGDTIFV